MSFQQRSHEAHSEAAEPLYRDSSDQAEKPSQHELDAQTQDLHSSIRRLRRWLIAVSVLLGLFCAYTLFSLRHVARDNATAKRLEFAPESMPLYFTINATGVNKHPSAPKTNHIRQNPLRLSINPRSRRSLGQRPHTSRRRLRTNPRPLSLLTPTRPALGRRIRRRGRNLRHLRLPPAALPQPRAHVLVHAQSGHGVQHHFRDVRQFA